MTDGQTGLPTLEKEGAKLNYSEGPQAGHHLLLATLMITNRDVRWLYQCY